MFFFKILGQTLYHRTSLIQDLCFGNVMSTYYEWKENQLFLSVYLLPGSARNEIVGPYGEYLKIKLVAAAAQHKANEALIDLLAQVFNVSKKSIRIIKGETHQKKIVSILVPEVEDFMFPSFP